MLSRAAIDTKVFELRCGVEHFSFGPNLAQFLTDGNFKSALCAASQFASLTLVSSVKDHLDASACQTLLEIRARRISSLRLCGFETWDFHFVQAVSELLRRGLVEHIVFFSCAPLTGDLVRGINAAAGLKTLSVEGFAFAALENFPAQECGGFKVAFLQPDDVRGLVIDAGAITLRNTREQQRAYMVSALDPLLCSYKHVDLIRHEPTSLISSLAKQKNLESLLFRNPVSLEELADVICGMKSLWSLEIHKLASDDGSVEEARLIDVIRDTNITNWRLPTLSSQVSTALCQRGIVTHITFCDCELNANILLEFFRDATQLLYVQLSFVKLQQLSDWPAVFHACPANLEHFLFQWRDRFVDPSTKMEVVPFLRRHKLRNLKWIVQERFFDEDIVPLSEALRTNVSLEYLVFHMDAFVSIDTESLRDLLLDSCSLIDKNSHNGFASALNVLHRRRCMVARAKRAVRILLCVRKFRRNSMLHVMTKDIVTYTAKLLFQTRGEVSTWWTPFAIDEKPSDAADTTKEKPKNCCVQ